MRFRITVSGMLSSAIDAMFAIRGLAVRRSGLPGLVCLIVVSVPGFLNTMAAAQDGLALFAAQCADCHGPRGEGTADVPARLFGDRPTIELADVITRTMPEGSPEDCVGEEAAAIAEWMQQAFYSPEAQARLNPPRISLSRLTVSQYRNAVADIISSFRWSAAPGDTPGLDADYYASRNFRREKRVIERVDPRISFQFGTGSPDGEKIAEDQFSATWSGSLIVRETGIYDFTVRSENGVRLYVNNNRSALIDAWVKSGTDSEFTGTRYLIGGRLYPVRLEWFKFNEPTASVELLWTPPHGVPHVIPPHCLTPQSSPEILVVETPFPPDDRSDGYERGTSVSPEWEDATTWAAVEVADKVVEMLPSLVGREERGRRRRESDSEGQQVPVRDFCIRFVEQAFRRPLDEEQQKLFVDAQFELSTTDEEAVRRVVLLALKSPRFLFREIAHRNDQFAVAERLAFSLLDSIPDRELLDQARAGQLGTAEEVRRQAWRLVTQYQARQNLAGFLRTWLNLGHLHDISRDSERFPAFTPALAADLAESMKLTIDHAALSEQATLTEFLVSNTTWLNHRLGEYYGVEIPDDGAFHQTDFEADRRAGIMTHPFLMAGLAYTATSSPIHRGVMVSRGILGRAIKPPPIAVAPDAPDLAPELTTRERVTLQTSPEVCANCHGTINSLGFTMENFDAVGRFRDSEQGRPIDASGGFITRSGERLSFAGPQDLIRFAADSQETHRSFTRQLFHHLVQQPVLAYGPEMLNELTTKFREADLKIQNLIVEIACVDARTPRDSLRTEVANADPE